MIPDQSVQQTKHMVMVICSTSPALFFFWQHPVRHLTLGKPLDSRKTTLNPPTRHLSSCHLCLPTVHHQFITNWRDQKRKMHEWAQGHAE
jgi:hypothetical protein